MYDNEREVGEGLRAAGIYALRYSSQVGAYLLLLTERYPYTGPAAREGELSHGAEGLPASRHAQNVVREMTARINGTRQYAECRSGVLRALPRLGKS